MMALEPGMVSVMMPAYNAAAYIEQAIQSLLAQTYQHWELLIVNDGSTDDTEAVARRFDDPRIRIFPKKNGGESTARNVALDHAQGEFVGFLDADDAYETNHLEVTVAYLRAHPDREAVYTDGVHIDEHGTRLASLHSRRRGPFEGRIYEHVVRASDVFGPPGCVVLRHALVARHQLRYDPRIVIGPDWDFFTRYSDLATFGYLDIRTYLYRVHQSNITAQVDRTRRAGFLALCRENAIGMTSFGLCSVETRAAVFYELLVNLLRGRGDRRVLILESRPFLALPSREQARLLRLTAADAMLHMDGEEATVGRWLDRASALSPTDWKATVLARLHRVSPVLCRRFMRAMSPMRGTSEPTAPLADLEAARPTGPADHPQ